MCVGGSVGGWMGGWTADWWVGWMGGLFASVCGNGENNNNTYAGLALGTRYMVSRFLRCWEWCHSLQLQRTRIRWKVCGATSNTICTVLITPLMAASLSFFSSVSPVLKRFIPHFAHAS